MQHLLSSRFALVVCLACATASPAQAEKADRYKPLTVEADLPGKIDLLNQIVVFNGNVVVTKGTMVIRAARIEVRESADGYQSAVAFGSAGQHATFRQTRDVANEFIAGDAERLEYDGRSEVVRLLNSASFRRLRGSTVADEIVGNLITYDSVADLITVSGGQPGTAGNPGGRIRAVLTPRRNSAAAAEAASAASGTTLKGTPALGEGR